MPVFPAMELKLKDGRCAVLREAVMEDLPELHAMLLAEVRDGRGVVQTEADLRPLEAYIEHRRAGVEGASAAQGCALVAELEGRVVGEAEARRFKLEALRHVAVLSVGIHPEAQGLGLGRGLMEGLLRWARLAGEGEAGPVLRLELNVRADNPRALSLYRSLGFVEEGCRRGFIRWGGVFVDDLTMALWLGE